MTSTAGKHTKTMKQQKNSTGCEAYATRRLRQRETAGRVTGCRSGGSPNVKGGQRCHAARLDANNGTNKSGQTRVRLPVRFLRSAAFFLAVVFLAVKVVTAQEVGELSQRTAPQNSEAALSVLQNARNEVQKDIATISSQGDGLAADTKNYKENPTPQNAIRLLQRMATTAVAGQRGSLNISAKANGVAKACAGLSARCLADGVTLRPSLDKAKRTQDESEKARKTGFNALRDLHVDLTKRGVSSDSTISDAERRKISQLLRLCGSADLAGKFARMEANTTDQVIQRLTALSEQFATRQHNFEELARAFEQHAESFKMVGASAGRVAGLVEKNGHYTAEAEAATALEGDLANIDTVLTRTFESLETDFTPALATGTTETTTSGSSGPSLWHRLLRFIGAESVPAAVATTETEGAAK